MSNRRAQDERIEGTPDGVNAITAIMDVPDAPTIGTATDNGDLSASITFTAPTTGGTASTYTVTSTPGSITGTGATSPITVSGLSASTSYTFKVKGVNDSGVFGPESSASNSVTMAMPIPGAYDALAVTTLSSATSSISFTGIPGNYKHLQLRVMARSSATGGTTQNLDMRINDDATTSYTFHQLQGSGSAAGSYGEGTGTRTACIQVVHVPTSSAASNIFGIGIIDILDYSSTSKNKTVKTFMGQEQNNSDGVVFLNSMLWTKSVPITKLEFYQGANNLTQNTTIALYGIK